MKNVTETVATRVMEDFGVARALDDRRREAALSRLLELLGRLEALSSDEAAGLANHLA